MRQQPVLSCLATLAATAAVALALLAPATAQFWNPFGGSDRQPQRRAPPPRHFNPFGFFGAPLRVPEEPATPQRPRLRPRSPADYSHAPPPARRNAEAAAVTSPILVLGDSMADWLAYGLEDAFSEKPEFGVARRHRATAGLIRYDPRRDIDWPQVIREAIEAERPKFIVMMVGMHDRQPIRERPPARAKAEAPAAAPQEDAEYHDPDSPESRARASAEQQNAEMRRAELQKAERDTAEPDGEPPAGAEPPRAAPSGPMEFQNEAWQAAYVRRIDAAIAAMKNANVPVFWVGLPPQRNARQAADAAFLNELYRTRAERAGIAYVDIWDGFVDEAGRYLVQGPDVDGQIRRLRSGDGIYFTRAGARKLAHFVEREILRKLVTPDTTVALPAPEPVLQPPVKPGTTARPLAGPVIPLITLGSGKELLGDPRVTPAGIDPLANRVLVLGEPISAPAGRADNFTWPRGSTATVREPGAGAGEAPQPVPSTAAAPDAPASGARGESGEPKQPAPPRLAPRADADAAASPPGPIPR